MVALQAFRLEVRSPGREGNAVVRYGKLLRAGFSSIGKGKGKGKGKDWDRIGVMNEWTPSLISLA